MKQIKIVPTITNRTHNLQRYFHDIEKIPQITPEEEIELAIKIKRGDKKAEAKLINANLRFVVSVAKQYAVSGANLEDLINEGNLGLIKAAQRFDETKGFKFISYAVWWIRQSILDYLGKSYKMIRLPANIQGAISKINKFVIEFEQKNERQPTIEEISQAVEIDTSRLNSINNLRGKELSLDSKINDDDEGTFADFLPSKNENIEEQISNGGWKKALFYAMDSYLTQVEKEILCLSFGIGVGGEYGMKNEEIGKKFHLCSERVRQIQNKALKKLKKLGEEKQLGYLESQM